MKHILLTTVSVALGLTLIGCSQVKDGAQDAVKDVASATKDVTQATTDAAMSTTKSAVETMGDAAKSVGETVSSGVDSAKLSTILAAQPAKVKARYQYRNPKATLEFFGIEPGMTVVEVLPGGGWYSKILLPYLGDEGSLIGVDYSLDMWPHFGGFATPEFVEKKKSWPTEWVTQATEWRGETGPELQAFAFGNRDKSLDGTADAALFIRALHNLNRFADKGDYMADALSDVRALLKDGGTLAIVQHRAPEGNSAEASTGGNGYLKQSALIETIEAAGFELVGTSEINANSKDVPANSDGVWRLPPTLSTSRENEELKTQMTAIGETDRMTLKFVKK